METDSLDGEEPARKKYLRRTDKIDGEIYESWIDQQLKEYGADWSQALFNPPKEKGKS